MKLSHSILVVALAAAVSACGPQDAEDTPAAEPVAEEQGVTEENTVVGESFDVAPGLSAKILHKGHGRAAEAGDYVEVHYTGWLYDAEAEDNRGDKFDSSVDRGERFHFELGAGRVIQGWDQGVAGMLIGEMRELTIAPEMGYGDRGAGNVIPPGATLVFEIELFGAEGSADTR